MKQSQVCRLLKPAPMPTQRILFVVDNNFYHDNDQPIDPVAATVLIREALAEFCMARGNVDRVRQYVDTRYSEQTEKWKEDKVEQVIYRTRLARRLHCIDWMEEIT